jgi:hypothetical protein
LKGEYEKETDNRGNEEKKSSQHSGYKQTSGVNGGRGERDRETETSKEA